MTGIVEIASFLPDTGIRMLDRLETFGVDEAFVRDKTGFTFVRRKADEDDTSDLCVRAFRRLQAKREIDPSGIDCLVVCTQNPDVHGLPQTSAIVHAKLGLPETCAVFDISLGCSGYVYGLAVVKAFMEAAGLSQGLLFTADPYSKIIDEDDKNTAMLFGDGAAVTLLGPEPRWRIGRSAFRTAGAQGGALRTRRDGVLEMNGRAVYTFSATKAPALIREVLEADGLSLADVDAFLLHQGSRFIVETIRERLGLSSDKAPFEAADIGNTVSSSIPLLLERRMPADGRRLLLAGFGVGLSWAAMLLEGCDPRMPA